MGMVAVLGTGGSIGEYLPIFDYTIGVNDVWKYVKTNALVCLDYPKVFNAERLKVINESKPEYFFSQIVAWDTRPDFRKIDLIAGYLDHAVNLDQPGYYKSFCSPFVATQIAWRDFGATEIHLFGVDLTNHPHLDKMLCAKIQLHFVNLNRALTAKGCQLIVHGSGILAPQL
jgi:hypothetical protein